MLFLFGFRGAVGRLAYFLATFVLAAVMFGAVLGGMFTAYFSALFNGVEGAVNVAVVVALIAVVCHWSVLALTAKRLRDIGLSGWHSLWVIALSPALRMGGVVAASYEAGMPLLEPLKGGWGVAFHAISFVWLLVYGGLCLWPGPQTRFFPAANQDR